MATNEPAHLHLVNPETGEITEQAPRTLAEALAEIQYLTDQLAGAENNVRSMRSQLALKNRELEGELDKEHKLFPEAMALWRYWQVKCNHPRCEFTADRMKILLPKLKKHGAEKCREAIRGAAFDPFITTQKNGRQKRHDDWGLIFRDDDKLENFCQRAPEYRDPTPREKTMMELAHEIAGRVLERSKLIESGKDSAAVSHLLIEINRLLIEWMKRSTEGEQHA